MQSFFVPLSSEFTAQKMKFSVKALFSKCHQILKKLRICRQSLQKSLAEIFICCAVISINNSYVNTENIQM